jgi:UDP:flavonoid glycosyltransferase YjiC (YdhE family)
VNVRASSLSTLLLAVQSERISTVNNGKTSGSLSDALPIDAAKYCPKLNIVIQVVGSLGDVQPFISISKELQRSGHRIRLATHAAFKGLVERHSIEFFDIGGDPGELMAFMVRNPGLIPSGRSTINGEVRNKREMVRQMLEGCWRSCFEPERPFVSDEKACHRLEGQVVPFTANAIIANPPAFAHHCAERLGIPLHIVFTYRIRKPVCLNQC